MNDRIKTMASTVLEWVVLYPLVALFWGIVLLDKLVDRLKITYYNLFGIEYIIQRDPKSGDYPIRFKR